MRPPWFWDGHWWSDWEAEEASWHGPRRGFFRGGEVRLALLSLLSEGPAHGYDLMKRLEERSGSLYRASAGTVYPVLQQLQDEDLVSADAADGKKVYSLTRAGRQEVSRNAEQIEAIWRRAEQWHEWGSQITPHTITLAVSVGQLVKTAFVSVKRHPDLADRVRAILEQAEETIRQAVRRGRRTEGESDR